MPLFTVPSYNERVTIHRFFIDPGQKIAKGSMVHISGPEVAHITRSLRKRPGDHLILLSEQRMEYSGIISAIKPNKISVWIESEREFPVEPGPRVTIGQALPKGRKMDKIVREATELGVEQIIPFTSERTIPRPRADQIREKTSRWHRIAVSAAQQSGRTLFPRVYPLKPLDDILVLPGFTRRMILVEPPGKILLRDHLRENRIAVSDSILILVGPEGGFSHAEVNRAKAHGFFPLTLGSWILRTETVAPVLLGILRYELNGLESQR